MPEQSQDPNIGQGYVDVANTGITALTPGHSGWILAVVLIVAILTAATFFERRSNDTAVSGLLLGITSSHQSQLSLIEGHRAEEFRRAQEAIRILSEALARDSERAGRAAVTAIESQTRTLENEGPTK